MPQNLTKFAQRKFGRFKVNSAALTKAFQKKKLHTVGTSKVHFTVALRRFFTLKPAGLRLQLNRFDLAVMYCVAAIACSETVLANGGRECQTADCVKGGHIGIVPEL